MDKIIFLNDKETKYSVEIKKMGLTIVSVKFLNTEIPSYITSGFQLINENNGKIMSDFSSFTTVYRLYETENNVIELSSDGSIYVDPVPTIKFYANFGGTLDGQSIQNASDYSDIVIPNPIPNENYKFTEWNPTIPTAGTIDSNKNFYAQFEYIPTLEEIKIKKIEEMNAKQQSIISSGCDVVLSDGTIEHFTLTTNDQLSLMGLQSQVASGIKQIPWHTSNHSEGCKYYSNIDMTIILQKCMSFVEYEVTLFRDIRIWINDLSTKEEVEAVTYSIPPLEYQSEVLKDILSKM